MELPVGPVQPMVETGGSANDGPMVPDARPSDGTCGCAGSGQHGRGERADASDLRYPLTLDTTRIRTELGFVEPTPERDALLATVATET